MFGLVDLSADLLVALFDAIAGALRTRKGLRNILLLLDLLVFAVALTLAIDPRVLQLRSSARTPFVLTSIAVFALLVPILAAFTDVHLKDLFGSESLQSVSRILGVELRSLVEQRRVLERRLTDESGPDEGEPAGGDSGLFDANLELNLNQLREYYVINKSQARSSFRMGVTSVVLGLVAILVGVGLLYADSGQGSRIGVAAVTGVAGLLAQFIGGSCFYLFNKAQDQSMHFYDRLTELQGTLLAVRLADLITDTDLANLTRQSIALALTGRTPASHDPKNISSRGPIPAGE